MSLVGGIAALLFAAAPAHATWGTPPRDEATAVAGDASPSSVSSAASLETPTAVPTSALPKPLKFKPKEKAISSDGRRTAVILQEILDTKGTLRCEKLVVRADDGTVADRTLYEAPANLWGIKWSPDGKYVAVHHRLSDREGRVIVVDTSTDAVADCGSEALRQVAPDLLGFVHAIYFSPDSRSLLVSCHPSGETGAVVPGRPGALFVVDAATGQVRKRVEWE